MRSLPRLPAGPAWGGKLSCYRKGRNPGNLKAVALQASPKPHMALVDGPETRQRGTANHRYRRRSVPLLREQVPVGDGCLRVLSMALRSQDQPPSGKLSDDEPRRRRLAAL